MTTMRKKNDHQPPHSETYNYLDSSLQNNPAAHPLPPSSRSWQNVEPNGGDPGLLPLLRRAWAGWSSPTGPAPGIPASEAHAFLMQFQSRNVRRKIQSLQQQERDQQQNQQQQLGAAALFTTKSGSSSDHRSNMEVATSTPSSMSALGVEVGSTWWACLALLCQTAVTDSSSSNLVSSSWSEIFFVAHPTERLFAAQTLLHRLRRVKLAEAIDWEAELVGMNVQHVLAPILSSSSSSPPLSSSPQTWDRFTQASNTVAVSDWSPPTTWDMMQLWMPWYVIQNHRWHPLLGHLLQSYLQAQPLHHQQPDEKTPDRIYALQQEERIKGEMTLLTLTGVAFLTASTAGPHAETTTRPLLHTLLAALVTTALRLAYPTYPANSHHPQQEASPPGSSASFSLMEMIQQAVGAVERALGAGPPAGIPGPTGYGPTLRYVLYTAWAWLPDTVLGSPGGARGKLSMDPKKVQAAVRQLKDSTARLWQGLRPSLQESEASTWLMLCEKWARFLLLPAEMVARTVPLALQHLHQGYQSAKDHHHQQQQQQQHHQHFCYDDNHVALSYLMALFESGSWTAEQVLTSALGLVDQGASTAGGQASHVSSANQGGSGGAKKRPTNRSKKRHKDILEQHVSSGDLDSGQSSSFTLEQAQEEARERGRQACQAAVLAWPGLHPLSYETMLHARPHQPINGEGPLGCLAACANACLPHLLQYHRSLSEEEMSFFASLSKAVQDMCASGNKTIRALAYEPILTLHGVLLEVVSTQGPLSSSLEEIIVQHFFKCAMHLAATCGYPDQYFADLSAPSDEEVEIERNDVRDVLRTVAGSGEGGSTAEVNASKAPLPVTVRILAMLLESCQHAILEAKQHQQLFPETVVHAFSSLAKPLNHVAVAFAGSRDTESRRVMVVCLELLGRISQTLSDSFHARTPLSLLLPLSRISCIASASLAPMMSALSYSCDDDRELLELLQMVLDAVVLSAILAAEHIPEVAAPNGNDDDIDTRGSMRGPGGEDHCGLLVLMRLTFESDALTKFVVSALRPSVARLCQLHQQLKHLELERGQGPIHGRGVTPQSRRILLSVLSHLELVSHGGVGASEILEQLFKSCITTIASLKGQSTWSQQELFLMCECSLDLAAFSQVIIASVFSDTTLKTTENLSDCVEGLVSACIQGYKGGQDVRALHQWNRLRAALFTLLRVSANPDLTARSAEVVISCISSECRAIDLHCNTNRDTAHSIFTDELVSTDGVPAGLFVRLTGEVLQQIEHRDKPSALNCVRVLFESRRAVLSVLTLPNTDTSTKSIVDPRPTLCEAWFLSLVDLMQKQPPSDEVAVLLNDSFVAAVMLFFYPRISRVQSSAGPGVSLDGPHGLAMTAFLSRFISHSTTSLTESARYLGETIQVDHITWQSHGDSAICGLSIFAAALFRCVRGALPPWGVELIADIYGSLFVAVRSDAALFELVMINSLTIRLATCSPAIGSVHPGQLLSEQNMSESACHSFTKKSIEHFLKGDSRSFKVLIKQATGGKKKETDFKQKPSYTKWDFQRI